MPGPDPSRARRAAVRHPGGRAVAHPAGRPTRDQALARSRSPGPTAGSCRPASTTSRCRPGPCSRSTSPSAASGEPFAVRLRSNRPVVARALAARFRRRHLRRAARPHHGRDAAPVARSHPGAAHRGLGETASVHPHVVLRRQGRGEPAPALSLAANATGIWDVPAELAYVVVTPTQGEPTVRSSLGTGRAAAAVPLPRMPDAAGAPLPVHPRRSAGRSARVGSRSSSETCSTSTVNTSADRSAFVSQRSSIGRRKSTSRVGVEPAALDDGRERDGLGVPVGGEQGSLLDRELDPVELCPPALLELTHHRHHERVEVLAEVAQSRHPTRRQRTRMVAGPRMPRPCRSRRCPERGAPC